MFLNRFFCITLTGISLFGYSGDSQAWGKDGHAAIGILAISQLQADSRNRLEATVGPLDEQVLMEACNWPDAVRETEEWEWSQPQHYINIPRGDFTYLESRDCPNQICATQAIKKYAADLANLDTSDEDRQQAFAWLCHLVGDLHQPMHAGFADDRGGNEFEIVVRNENMNLHRFWDSELINHHTDGWRDLVGRLQTNSPTAATTAWSPELVNDWTDESHALAAEQAYPASRKIDEAYEQQSWGLAQQRMSTAASRLAQLINTVLQNQD
jgi:hypothetical protein